MTPAEFTQVRAIYAALEASESTVRRLQRDNEHLLQCLSWALAPWYGKLWIRARQWWRERHDARP